MIIGLTVGLGFAFAASMPTNRTTPKHSVCPPTAHRDRCPAGRRRTDRPTTRRVRCRTSPRGPHGHHYDGPRPPGGQALSSREARPKPPHGRPPRRSPPRRHVTRRCTTDRIVATPTSKSARRSPHPSAALAPRDRLGAALRAKADESSRRSAGAGRTPDRTMNAASPRRAT
jgi:hypothetical protein